MRTRRTKIGVFYCEANVSWSNSHLKFVENSGGERKEVILKIANPSDVEYIRGQLNKIVDSWRKQLGSLPN